MAVRRTNGLRFELASLKQLLNRGLGDELLWLDTALMPADPLTKDSTDDALDGVLQHLTESNMFTMNASDEVKQAKVRKATQRTELKKEKKSSAVRKPAAMKRSDD